MVRIRIVLIAVGDVFAIIGLHRLGSSVDFDWKSAHDWLALSSPMDGLAELARLVALVIGYWLALGLLLEMVAAVTRIPAVIQASDLLGLPGVRGVLRGTVGISVAVGSLATPLAARAVVDLPDPIEIMLDQEAARTYVPTPAGLAEPNRSSTSSPVAVSLPRNVPRPPAIGHADVAVQPASVYVVEPGDNLWTIARRTITATTGVAEPSGAEIVPYWQRVISANRERLRSGDPDLIYPGEEILLPPLSGR
jgi:hypothetical protein